MNPNEWTERYEITSVKGRIWSRAMVRAAVLRLGRRLGLPVQPEAVDAVLDDDPYMRFRKGEIPTRVVEAVHMEARLRGAK